MTNEEKAKELSDYFSSKLVDRCHKIDCLLACLEMAKYKDKKIAGYLRYFIKLSNEGNLLKLQKSIESVIKEFEL